jgi:hypothetical protein
MQLLASHFGEEKLLRAARMYELATDWNVRRPALADMSQVTVHNSH